jgi:hypothetical protein
MSKDETRSLGKCAERFAMSELEIEKLRLSLIQSSIDFMATINDASLVAFMEVERRKIAMICNADYEVLRSLALMRDSAKIAPLTPAVGWT